MALERAQKQKIEVEKPSTAALKEPTQPNEAASARAQATEVRGGSGENASSSAGPTVQLSYSSAELQAKEIRSAMDPQTIKEKAAEGLTGQARGLPYMDKIQQSFGSHDVSGVQAHVGANAEKAAGAMGAKAYTSGNQVAFQGNPDLKTAAHEAAHVVQQRGGVQLKDGVGQVGDTYERHADIVAERVVQGKSAEALLNSMTPVSSAQQTSAPTQMVVQRVGERLDQPLPEGAETPEHYGGRGAGEQRRYSVEQYIEMWEAERGVKMTDEQKKDLARGCIGIVVVNLDQVVNPPLKYCFATFEQAEALMNEWNEFMEQNKNMEFRDGKMGDYEAVLFGKLFWSNQNQWDPSLSEEENRAKLNKGDPNAFKPDPKTGRVDMSGYRYQGRPKLDEGWYVNFDYAFWDKQTQTFWHANHCEPGMQVYQSTKEKFAKGYTDFDRCIYCVWISKKFDFEAAARNHA